MTSPAADRSSSISTKGSQVGWHTPGPWHLHHQRAEFMAGDCDWSLQTEREGAFLLFCHHPDAPAHANARLIAAAPDLLAALRRILENIEPDCHEPDCHEPDCPDCAAWRQARAAVAKATGV